jgi:hypothetical protein
MDWGKMDLLARSNSAGVEAGHWPAALPPAWAKLKTVLALAPPEYYTPTDLDGLRNFARSGGTVVVSLGMAQALVGGDLAVWSDLPSQQAYGKGRLFISREPVYQLFNSQSAGRLASFWQTLFGRTLPGQGQGFIIQTNAGYLDYQMGPVGERLPWPPTWPGQALARYATDGLSRTFTPADWSGQPLQRSEFVFGLVK